MMHHLMVLLQTPVPIWQGLLLGVPCFLLGRELFQFYQWWRMGRIVQGIRDKAKDAEDGTIIDLPPMTLEEARLFKQRWDESTQGDNLKGRRQ